MQSKPGQLEQAAGGTLFLDEVGEMSPPAQAKLLRVLQEREFQRLGGTRVAARPTRASSPPPTATCAGDRSKAQFREDLYYRLNVFAIRLPPLRERPDDILPLVDGVPRRVRPQRSAGRRRASRARRAQALLAYRGRATSASCATCSSAPRSCATAA